MAEWTIRSQLRRKSDDMKNYHEQDVARRGSHFGSAIIRSNHEMPRSIPTQLSVKITYPSIVEIACVSLRDVSGVSRSGIRPSKFGSSRYSAGIARNKF